MSFIGSLRSFISSETADFPLSFVKEFTEITVDRVETLFMNIKGFSSQIFETIKEKSFPVPNGHMPIGHFSKSILSLIISPTTQSTVPSPPPIITLIFDFPKNNRFINKRKKTTSLWPKIKKRF